MQMVNSADFGDTFPTKRMTSVYVSVTSDARDPARFSSASVFRVALPFRFNAIVRIRLVSLEFPNTSFNVDGNNKFTFQVPDATASSTTVTIPPGNYGSVDLLSAVQRAVTSADPYLRLEGTMDHVTLKTSLSLLRVTQMKGTDPLRFVSPLRVEFALPPQAPLPSLGDMVSLHNLDTRELEDGSDPVETMYRALAQGSQIPDTFVRLRVPNRPGTVAPAAPFGGTAVFCGIPTLTKLDFSAESSLSDAFGFPQEKTSMSLMPTQTIDLLPQDPFLVGLGRVFVSTSQDDPLVHVLHDSASPAAFSVKAFT